MTPLRAFLMVRCAETAWSVRVCSDLDAVLQTWREWPDQQQCTAILHVGFDRPLSHTFDEIAQQWPGRVLLTASARYSLPKGFQSSALRLSAVNGLPVYLALTGWGYEASQDDLERINRLTTLPVMKVRSPPLSGWIAAFEQQHPADGLFLRGAAINDEESYLANEHKLDRDLRYRLGIFRYGARNKSGLPGISGIVAAAPPWLLERSIETLALPVRAANVFQTNNIKVIGDLAIYPDDELIRLQNFGRKSLAGVKAILLDALNEGPFDIEDRVADADIGTLVGQIEQTLNQLEDRERDVLTRRMGFRQHVETLQEIAEDYGLTRERVRQIETKSLRKLLHSVYWDDLLIRKLERLLQDRDFPLPVLGVEAIDKWFAGMGGLIALLRYLLGECCVGRVSIIRVGDIEYFARVDQSEWDYALHQAHQLLASGAGNGWSEEHCRSAVGAILPEPVREFQGLLWEKAKALCHFSEAVDGTRVLASYGRGAEQLVEAVLWESEKPLHYSEIAERTARKSARPLDIRRVHGAAAAVGLLFGRGVYGLEKHLKISPEDANTVREETEQLIMNGPEERQWHTSELCMLIAEQNPTLMSGVTKYVLDVLLHQSAALKPLGRMTWVQKPTLQGTATSRIDLRQAVISLLEDAGSPLPVNEIRQRLMALRGVNETFQIHAQEPLIRVAPGLWGLNDRDVPIKRSQQRDLIEALIQGLRVRSEGIHVSELAEMNLPFVTSATSPYLVLTLASLTPRLRTSVGQYIYLSEWSDARRASPTEAVNDVLDGAQRPLSTEEIRFAVEARIRRTCDARTVLACLQAAEAQFNSDAGTWTAGERSERTEEDVEIEAAVAS